MFIDRKEVKRVDEFAEMGPEELKAYITGKLAEDDDADATRH
jgi:hypothetical protein